MAPLHHHFEKAGWAESKIIVRFWILGSALQPDRIQHAEDPMSDSRRIGILGLARSGRAAAQLALATGTRFTHPMAATRQTLRDGGASVRAAGRRSVELGGHSDRAARASATCIVHEPRHSARRAVLR